jgi:hypothetical protein
MIAAWTNRDPIISALHLMSVAMSQDRPINAVSLSTVCEPDVLDAKDCLELALQIFGHYVMLLCGCLETQLNNYSVLDRSLGFLPISPPDVFPVDTHSSDTFQFPDPLHGSNA